MVRLCLMPSIETLIDSKEYSLANTDSIVPILAHLNTIYLHPLATHFVSEAFAVVFQSNHKSQGVNA